MLKILAVSFIFLTYSLAGYGQQALNTLKEYSEFKKLAAQPLNSNLGDLQSVKVVYDTKEDKLYFINSQQFQFHYMFCVNYLNYTKPLEEFNDQNYSPTTNREYILANVNYSPDSKIYLIDFSVFDQIQTSSIFRIYDKIKSSSYFGKDLKVFLNTARLMEMKSTLQAKVSVMLPSELYLDKTFQEISQGKKTGQLRIEENLDSLKTPLKPTDILITHGTPKYFPNVRAIIIDEFQTPLSHLVILGRNRGIPIAVDRTIFQDTNLMKLNGEWIELKVTDRRIYYSLTKPGSGSSPNGKPIELTVDTTIREFISVDRFVSAGKNSIGNKAYNFGILEQLKAEGHYKTPEVSFAIPFYFYLEHVQNEKTQALLQEINSLLPEQDSTLQRLLKELRKSIKSTPVNAELVKSIRSELEQSKFTTFRFRSSTNAEDAEGFSGAGLYDSKTVNLNDSIKTIEKAITDVWASLWSYQAFQERRFFLISDKNLAMGILVHRSFPEEEANGVVITKNVYRQNYPGISVNVQFGDVSVVQPPENTVCDQLVIVYEQQVSGFDRTVEYISTSSLGKGTPVLSDKELKQLEAAVESIKEYYWNYVVKRYHYRSYENFGLDLEFKFQGKNRELYIKQVRIYNG